MGGGFCTFFPLGGWLHKESPLFFRRIAASTQHYRGSAPDGARRLCVPQPELVESLAAGRAANPNRAAIWLPITPAIRCPDKLDVEQSEICGFELVNDVRTFMLLFGVSVAALGVFESSHLHRDDVLQRPTTTYQLQSMPYLGLANIVRGLLKLCALWCIPIFICLINPRYSESCP